MNIMKKIWNIFTTILVIAVVLLAVALAGVRLVGLQPFTVLSGSMEPTYHTGSLIYVKKVDYRELQAGDPITFMLDENTVATHRIIEIVPDEEDPDVLRYRTKGDANEHEDGGLVHYKNIIGKPLFAIPKLGYVANYVQNPPGTYIALCAGAFAILLMFLPELIKALTEDEEEEKKQKRKPGPEKPRLETPVREPEPKKNSRNNKYSAEYDSISTLKSVIPVTEPDYDEPQETKEMPVDKAASAEQSDTDTYFSAAPAAESVPTAEDRPLTRAELRRQTEQAERSRAPISHKASGRPSRVLPQKKKGRHEL